MLRHTWPLSYMKQGSGSVILPSAPNPNFTNNVLLICGFNGVDGATTTTDEAKGHTSFSFQGDAQLDTAEKKFGTASLKLDGTLDCVGLSDSGDWDIGSTADAFQVEAWIRFDPSANLSNIHTILSHWAATGNNRAWKFEYDGTGTQLRFQHTTGGITTLTMVTGAWSPSVSTWYHVAMSRVGTTARLFVDGQIVGSATNSDNPHNPSASIRIGGVESGGANVNLFHGWIDELRFCKEVVSDGAAGFYTTAFLPPTAEFPRS